ncbi:MAG: hypothetical protein RLZZ539_1185, partial [Pseudomonadota bacterium]
MKNKYLIGMLSIAFDYHVAIKLFWHV